MFNRYKLPALFLLLIALGLCAGTAQADLVLTFGFAGDADTTDNTGDTVPVLMAGDNFTMNVYAHHDEAATIEVDAFNFVIDFGADGTDSPGPFIVDNGTGFSVSTGASGINGSLTASDNTFPFFDVGVTWLGSAFTLSGDNTAPTLLFTIDGTLDAGAADGIYDVSSINFGIDFSLGGTSTIAGPPYVFDGGQIEISSIPEPSGLILFAAPILGLGLRRRRA